MFLECFLPYHKLISEGFLYTFLTIRKIFIKYLSWVLWDDKDESGKLFPLKNFPWVKETDK